MPDRTGLKPGGRAADRRAASRRDRAARSAGYGDWNGFLEKLRGRADCAEIAARSGLRLIPAGEGWKACCPFHCESSPSLHMSGRLFHCFGAGCGAQGDAIGFAMRLWDLDFTEAALLLAREFELPVPPSEGLRRRRVPPAAAAPPPALTGNRAEPQDRPRGDGPESWPAGLPPAAAPLPDRRGALPVWTRLAGHTAVAADRWHSYRRRSGGLICFTARLERSSGKILFPVTWRAGPEGRGCWAALGFGSGRKRPVYGMERLRKGMDSILLVEGEKTADAAERLLGGAGWACLSPMGGDRASGSADWYGLTEPPGVPKPLYAAVWPDADRRRAGQKRLPAAEAADRALTGLAEEFGGVGAFLRLAEARVVLPPEELPHGWDLADAELAGHGPGWASRRLAAAVRWTGPDSGWDRC